VGEKAGIADGDSGESRELPGPSDRSFARMLLAIFARTAEQPSLVCPPNRT